MKKSFISSLVGSAIGFSISLLVFIYLIPKPAKTIYQKEEVEIVAVYQISGGRFETCLSHKDGTRSLWTDHKMGEAGDKFFVWRNLGTEYTQNPNN